LVSPLLRTEKLPTLCQSPQLPQRPVALSVSQFCVSRWAITRKLGESEDLHGVQCDVCDYVSVSNRAVALSKQVGYINVVAGDYIQFKFGKRVRQYVAPTQRRDGLVNEDVREAEEEEVPAESRTIL
ncbi:hypothetical protein T12_13234, partial [Trichinella patagoniensis]